MVGTLIGTTIAIPNTDTETSLRSAVEGLSGVTITELAGTTLISFAERKIEIFGSLTKLRTEEYSFDEDCPFRPIEVMTGGTYIDGEIITENGVDNIRPSGRSAFARDVPNNNGFQEDNYACIYVRDGGTCRLFGTQLDTLLPLGFKHGATVQIRDCHFSWDRQVTSKNVQIRYIADFDVIGLTVTGQARMTAYGFVTNFLRYNPVHYDEPAIVSSKNPTTGAINDGGHGDEYFTVTSYTGQGNGTDITILNRNFRQTLLINPRRGPLKVIGHGNTNNRDGLGEVRQNVDFRIIDGNSAVLSGAKIFMRDTNNGARVNWARSTRNYTNDRTYLVTTDSNGEGTMQIMTAIFISNNNISAASWDLRTVNNDEDERLLNFGVWAYGKLYGPIDVDVAGLEDFQTGTTLFDDINITEQLATVQAYTTIAINHTSQTITLSGATTLNQLYDFVAANKLDNLESPTLNSLAIEVSGQTLITDYDIVNAQHLSITDEFNRIVSTGDITIPSAVADLNLDYEDATTMSVRFNMPIAVSEQYIEISRGLLTDTTENVTAPAYTNFIVVRKVKTRAMFYTVNALNYDVAREQILNDDENVFTVILTPKLVDISDDEARDLRTAGSWSYVFADRKLIINKAILTPQNFGAILSVIRIDNPSLVPNNGDVIWRNVNTATQTGRFQVFLNVELTGTVDATINFLDLTADYTLTGTTPNFPYVDSTGVSVSISLNTGNDLAKLYDGTTERNFTNGELTFRADPSTDITLQIRGYGYFDFSETINSQISGVDNNYNLVLITRADTSASHSGTALADTFNFTLDETNNRITVEEDTDLEFSDLDVARDTVYWLNYNKSWSYTTELSVSHDDSGIVLNTNDGIIGQQTGNAILKFNFLDSSLEPYNVSTNPFIYQIPSISVCNNITVTEQGATPEEVNAILDGRELTNQRINRITDDIEDVKEQTDNLEFSNITDTTEHEVEDQSVLDSTSGVDRITFNSYNNVLFHRVDLHLVPDSAGNKRIIFHLESGIEFEHITSIAIQKITNNVIVGTPATLNLNNFSGTGSNVTYSEEDLPSGFNAFSDVVGGRDQLLVMMDYSRTDIIGHNLDNPLPATADSLSTINDTADLIEGDVTNVKAIVNRIALFDNRADVPIVAINNLTEDLGVTVSPSPSRTNDDNRLHRLYYNNGNKGDFVPTVDEPTIPDDFDNANPDSDKNSLILDFKNFGSERPPITLTFPDLGGIIRNPTKDHHLILRLKLNNQLPTTIKNLTPRLTVLFTYNGNIVGNETESIQTIKEQEGIIEFIFNLESVRTFDGIRLFIDRVDSSLEDRTEIEITEIIAYERVASATRNEIFALLREVLLINIAQGVSKTEGENILAEAGTTARPLLPENVAFVVFNPMPDPDDDDALLHSLITQSNRLRIEFKNAPRGAGRTLTFEQRILPRINRNTGLRQTITKGLSWKIDLSTEFVDDEGDRIDNRVLNDLELSVQLLEYRAIGEQGNVTDQSFLSSFTGISQAIFRDQYTNNVITQIDLNFIANVQGYRTIVFHLLGSVVLDDVIAIRIRKITSGTPVGSLVTLNLASFTSEENRITYSAENLPTGFATLSDIDESNDELYFELDYTLNQILTEYTPIRSSTPNRLEVGEIKPFLFDFSSLVEDGNNYFDGYRFIFGGEIDSEFADRTVIFLEYLNIHEKIYDYISNQNIFDNIEEERLLLVELQDSVSLLALAENELLRVTDGDYDFPALYFTNVVGPTQNTAAVVSRSIDNNQMKITFGNFPLPATGVPEDINDEDDAQRVDFRLPVQSTVTIIVKESFVFFKVRFESDQNTDRRIRPSLGLRLFLSEIALDEEIIKLRDIELVNDGKYRVYAFPIHHLVGQSFNQVQISFLDVNSVNADRSIMYISSWFVGHREYDNTTRHQLADSISILDGKVEVNKDIGIQNNNTLQVINKNVPVET